MTLYQAEYKARIRREKAQEAINLAMEALWEDAVAVNLSIIEISENDTEAHNRLGKALLELGQYDKAHSAFNKALGFSPGNSISRKNIERLRILKRDALIPKHRPRLGPRDFLGESAKTVLSVLEQPALQETIAKVSPGDALSMNIYGRKVVVTKIDGEYLGEIPLRLASRLIKLMDGGNLYRTAVARLKDNEVTVIIKEILQDPSQLGLASFPSQMKHQYLQSPRGIAVELDDEEGAEDQIEPSLSFDWPEKNEDDSILLVELLDEISNSDDEEEF